MVESGQAGEDLASPAGAWLLVTLDHDVLVNSQGALAFLDEPDLPRLASDALAAGLGDAVVVATCERLEIFCSTENEAAAYESCKAIMAAWLARASLPPGQFCRLRGRAALRHLFRVAAALESRVPGEPRVLGQVKDCHRVAREAGLLGPQSDAAFQTAFAAAKRVRSETALAEQPVSIAAAAIRIARQIQGDLGDSRLLLAGIGEMSELLAEQFQAAGLRRIALSHPTERRAATLARRLGAEVFPWEGLGEALATAEIVVAALGAGRYTVTREMMQTALRRRRQRPMYVIDAAVPRDVEPSVEGLDQAYLYDLADLERVVEAGRANRAAAALAAEALVETGVEGFLRRREERAAVPAVQALRAHIEALRQEILADPRLGAAEATRLFAQRLLHDPSAALRKAAAEDPESRAALEKALARLFPLDGGGRKPGPKSKNEDE